MPGAHCVALCISDSGYAEYFDSYGSPPYRLEIIAFLQRHSISWTFNRNRLQGLTSNVCGHYCCIYVLHKAGGQTMTSFVDMFRPVRYTCNDKKQCACSALSFESAQLATSWSSSSSSSRANRRYK